MTQQQLNMLRSQIAGQQLIVQAPQTQIFQTQSGQNIAIPMNIGGGQVYLNPQALQQQQQIQQQQQQSQQVKEEH